MYFDPAIEDVYQKILQGDKVFLARAITWMESNSEVVRNKALQLISKFSDINTNTIRIAVTGSPGVGKSTLIEALGIKMISNGHKIAVLAVDPSSKESHGSILGDKTRMNQLSQNANAFVRPSPAGLELGGVNNSTRESILMCENAGYDIIFIETVGVGQSEVEVNNMADIFLLLVNPGGGDDLQGIKKGIVEMADIIAITKYDGHLKEASKHAYNFIKQSQQVLKHSVRKSEPKVINVSATEDYHLDELINNINSLTEENKLNKSWEAKRYNQEKKWFELGLYKRIEELLKKDELIQNMITEFGQNYDSPTLPIPVEIENHIQKLKPRFNLK